MSPLNSIVIYDGSFAPKPPWSRYDPNGSRFYQAGQNGQATQNLPVSETDTLVAAVRVTSSRPVLLSSALASGGVSKQMLPLFTEGTSCIPLAITEPGIIPPGPSSGERNPVQEDAVRQRRRLCDPQQPGLRVLGSSDLQHHG